MIKKITIILICILILAGGVYFLINRGIIASPFGNTNPVTDGGLFKNGWGYEVSDDGSITLTAYTGNESSVQVPSVIDDVPVTSLGESLFANNTRIKEVTIPESVTSLGNGIFENCTSLTLVNIPQSLQRIPQKAFSGCKNLNMIQLPGDLRSIGANAFSGCTELSYISMPDSITTVNSEAFLNCEKLREIDFSKNLRSIGTHAFKGTPWLSSQTDTFVIIGSQVLIKYNGIDEVIEVPLGVASITDAFEDNMFPIEIILPESLTSIGPHAFSGCRALETINIPNGVRTIGESAFRGCSHLTSITLPDSLTSLGASAFQSCSSLERIFIPYGVASMPSLVLANCEKLRTVQIPETVISIANNALVYSGISDLRVVRGSAGETFAQENGYSYSYQQQSTGDFIFQQTDAGVQIVLYVGSIYDVVIPEKINGEDVTSLSDILFQHNSYVRTVSLPKTITSISDYSFADMEDLRTVEFPDTLTSIGMAAFQNDVMLGDLEIPESVTYIADDAFVGCPSLVIIAKEGTYAFDWAVQAGIRIKDNASTDTASFSFVKPAGSTLLSGYSGSDNKPELPRLTEYGETVTGIEAETFRGAALTAIEIPEGYETIGEYAFADINEPFEITIPKSVSYIADNAFDGTQIIIHGYNGSYAESFARSQNIKFLVIADWEL